jgi:hypothetical protein
MKPTKRSLTGLLAALFITGGIFVGCQKEAQMPEVTSGATASIRPTVTCKTYEACNYWARTLVAGQDIIVGEPSNIGGGVIVQKVGNNLVVTAKIGEGMDYYINELHVYIGTDEGLDGPGKSVSPGQFPYKTTGDGDDKELSVTVPISELTANESGCYTVAVHAALDGYGGTQDQTAWGCGDRILGEVQGGNWGMKFTICVQEDCEPNPPTDHCTLSQGYWLANTGVGQVRSNVTWDDVVFGSVNISQAYLVSKFPAKNNSLLKALFQATALQLDVRETALTWDDVPADVKTAYQTISSAISSAGSIEAYLNIKNQTTIKTLQAAASVISTYIKAAHCESAVHDQQTDAGTI